MRMAKYRVVQPQVDCCSAGDFLDALSPLGPYFGSAKPRDPWLYRGMGGDYRLIPSAYRKDTRLALLTKRDISMPEQRSLAERDVLIQFFEIADRRGLLLPDDSQALRSTLE